MKTEKRARGDRGEDAAVGYLRRRLYRILDRNYRAGGAEIDIVAKRGKTLAFVEVKTRRLEPGSETRLTRPAKSRSTSGGRRGSGSRGDPRPIFRSAST